MNDNNNNPRYDKKRIVKICSIAAAGILALALVIFGAVKISEGLSQDAFSSETERSLEQSNHNETSDDILSEPEKSEALISSEEPQISEEESVETESEITSEEESEEESEEISVEISEEAPEESSEEVSEESPEDVSEESSEDMTEESSEEVSEESSEDVSEESSEESYFESSEEEAPKIPWNLLLVNPQNPLPDDFQCVLTELEGEINNDGDVAVVDERIADALTKMLADARAEGLIPIITSSYRTVEKQQEVMEEYIQDYMNNYGYSREAAEEAAKRWVAIPGTSEHHTGLAVDISSADLTVQDTYYIWSWLEKHAWEYGFILRYTEENQQITGVNPEPWHYRYVGVEAAKYIYEAGITLEEYLGVY